MYYMSAYSVIANYSCLPCIAFLRWLIPAPGRVDVKLHGVACKEPSALGCLWLPADAILRVHVYTTVYRQKN